MSHEYYIGSDHCPGLSKLIEELGECSQVCGKIIGFGGFGKHWDGSDLEARLIEEMADVTAAIAFVCDTNHLSYGSGQHPWDRVKEKLNLFHQWHEEQRQKE